MHSPKIFEELPPYREAMARGDWARAIALLEAKAGPHGLAGLAAPEALQLAALHGLRGGLDAAMAILNHLAAGTNPLAASEALLQLANLKLSNRLGAFEEIAGLARQAAALAGQDKRLLGLTAHVQSRLHWRKLEVKEAGDRLKEARALLEEAGDEEELAKVLDSLAMFHEHCGNREKALSCYSLSLSKKAQWRDLYGLGITLGNLGRFHLSLDEPETALSCLLDDLRIVKKVGDLRAQVGLKINIGQALTALGRLKEAQKELEEALALAREKGWRQQEIYALKDLARAVAMSGEHPRAFALLDAAIELLPEKDATYPKGQVLLERGELHLGLKEYEAARDAFEGARKIFSQLGAKQKEALAIHGLARIAERLKQWNSCLHFLEQGMTRMASMDSPLMTRFEETFRTLHLAVQEQVAPRSIGPYRILNKIGGGAFKEVFRAFDTREESSRQDVAIKVLRLEGVKDAVDRHERISRFQRECEILSRISHPNIVRLIDAGEEPVPFMVEELVDGGDLAGLLKEKKVLAVEEAAGIIAGILKGLMMLHSREIIHRDLKPGNILLRKGGEPVIVDFGIARMMELAALTLQSAVLGTLAYMAPEQRRGEAVDERADIYSVGVIFFELVTGKLPFEERVYRELLLGLCHETAPDLAGLAAIVPGPVRACILKCLEPDREKRYAEAGEILPEVEGWRGG